MLTNRIHTVRPDMAVGDKPLCLGHLVRQPPGIDFLRALIGEDVEAVERHPAVYDGVAGDLYVDKFATLKDRPCNALASRLRTQALLQRDPDKPDALLLRGKAVLVLPMTIADGAADESGGAAA